MSRNAGKNLKTSSINDRVHIPLRRIFSKISFVFILTFVSEIVPGLAMTQIADK